MGGATPRRYSAWLGSIPLLAILALGNAKCIRLTTTDGFLTVLLLVATVDGRLPLAAAGAMLRLGLLG